MDIFRSAHKNIPILVISRPRYASFNHKARVRLENKKRRKVQHDTVKEFKLKGDENIYFLDGATLMGEHFEEMTVDGVHPTDLGFFKMAEGLYPILKTVLLP
ncbi:MAG: hypothetical protein GX974_08725 [Clostridiales bacterium]|nr:hypothetical protein [Clostridiales bacterium]